MHKGFDLDSRLKGCAKAVVKGSKLVDIGTDHAYLPIWLILNNLVSEVIAADVREEPLKRALNNIKKYGLEDKIETRLSDGLEKINKSECETVVIAGMGAETIIAILDNADWLKDCKKLKLILQPMTAAEKLRRYLSKNGYYIWTERAVQSNFKSYSVMEVKAGQETDESILYPYIGKIFLNAPKDVLEMSAALKYADKEVVNLFNRLTGLKVRQKKYEAENLFEIIQAIKKEMSDYNEEYNRNL